MYMYHGNRIYLSLKPAVTCWIHSKHTLPMLIQGGLFCRARTEQNIKLYSALRPAETRTHVSGLLKEYVLRLEGYLSNGYGR